MEVLCKDTFKSLGECVVRLRGSGKSCDGKAYFEYDPKSEKRM